MKETYEYEYDPRSFGPIQNIKWKVSLKDGEDVIEKLIDNWDFSLLKKVSMIFQYREPILNESIFGSVTKEVEVSSDLNDEKVAKKFLKKVTKVAKKLTDESSEEVDKLIRDAFHILSVKLRDELDNNYEPVIEISPSCKYIQKDGFRIHKVITHKDKSVNVDVVYTFALSDPEYIYYKKLTDVDLRYRVAIDWIIDGKKVEANCISVELMRQNFKSIKLNAKQLKDFVEKSEQEAEECWQLLRESKDPIGAYESFEIDSLSKTEIKILMKFKKRTLHLNLSKAELEDSWNWEFADPGVLLPARYNTQVLNPLLAVKDFYSLTSYLIQILGMKETEVNVLKNEIQGLLPKTNLNADDFVIWHYKCNNFGRETYIKGCVRKDLIEKVANDAYETARCKENFTTTLVSNIRGSFELLVTRDFEKVAHIYIKDTSFYPSDFEKYKDIIGDTTYVYESFVKELASRFWDETKVKEEAIY